jgi:hypothetical protein
VHPGHVADFTLPQFTSELLPEQRGHVIHWDHGSAFRAAISHCPTSRWLVNNGRGCALAGANVTFTNTCRGRLSSMRTLIHDPDMLVEDPSPRYYLSPIVHPATVI